MDDRELDAKLGRAKREADRFFSHWADRTLEEGVYRRIRTRTLGSFPFPALCRAAAITGTLLLLAVVVLQVSNPAPAGVGTPVAQEAVPLEEQGPVHWVNFFRVTQPDSLRESLLAVLWAPQPEGGWQPVYSSLLAGNGDPLPISTVELPGSLGQLVVISSWNRQQEYLSYRLVGYDAGQIVPYHERDYVPRGEIEVAQGFLVERRAATWASSPGSSQAGQAVTNLIPYHIDAQGKITVPEAPLPLEVGQYLILVGNDAGDRVQAFAQGGISPLQEGFYASAGGDACIILIADNDPRRKAQLTFKVLDPQTK